MKKSIFVATVHWESGNWIKPQYDQLIKHLPNKPKIYAYLNKFETAQYEQYFHYFSTENIQKHNLKLNILADKIAEDANDKDILIFIDGDAFPIDDLLPYIDTINKGKIPLVAVQRLENFGDIQPHPCFCITSVGFWKTIKGNWNPGYQWTNSEGKKVTDVGGNVLRKLRKYKWKKLNRSNMVNLHPLWFGIYDNKIYHHGAAFRTAISRIDQIVLRKKRILNKNYTYNFLIRKNNRLTKIVSDIAINAPSSLKDLFLGVNKELLSIVNKKMKQKMNNRNETLQNDLSPMELKWGRNLVIRHNNFGNANYIKVLRNIHNKLNFKTYFEIGVRFGDSLKEAKNNCVGVDPAFRIKHNIMEHKNSLSLFQKNSDDFFKVDAKVCFKDKKIDLAFLDGLHTSDQLLIDFIMTERYSHKESLIILHDALPRTVETIQRIKPSEINMWTGDVWKVVPYLKKYRPDLKILILDAPPSGLVLISNLNPQHEYKETLQEIQEKIKNSPNDSKALHSYLNDIRIVSSDSFIKTITKTRSINFKDYESRKLNFI